MRNKILDATALTIAIIGAINWGLVGLSGLYLLTFYMRLSDRTDD